MRRSRSERTLQAKNRRHTITLAAAVALAVLLVLTAAVWAVGVVRGDGPEPAQRGTPDLNLVAIETTPALEATATTLATGSVPATGSLSTPVEVPDVTGKPIAEAELLLKAAGLVVERRDTTQVVADATKIVVVSQDPSAGTVVDAGTTVLLRVPSTGSTAMSPAAGSLIVCIDPGHQAKSDARKEPNGPGSTVTKARVLGGTTGTTTRLPEYEVTLQIAMNLKARLEAAGITVVMTRTTNDVSISNAERAQIANAAKANLFVRIHCDGSTDSSVTGISTLYPGANAWTSRISGPSKTAATAVHNAVVASTGAVSRGISARTDQTGFNWAQVPAVTVECGFMTNPVEDKLLASPHYQDKLAQGITNGIQTYLGAN